MGDATRTIEIEQKNTTQFENTELSGGPHGVHRGLKGCARDERCDAVPLAWMLETCTDYKLQVETSTRTFDSMGIAGSDLGRPALAGLSRFTTWVEETIAKAKSCDDVKAQVVASERSATTRAVTSTSRTIDAVERLTRLNEGMAKSLVLQHGIMLRVHEAFERFKAIYTVVHKNCVYAAWRWSNSAGLQCLSKQTLHTLLTRKRRTQTLTRRRMFLTLAKWLLRTTRRLCNVERAPAAQGGSAASARFGAGEVM